MTSNKKTKRIGWFLVFLFFAILYYLNPDLFKEISRVKDIRFINFLMLSVLCVSNQFLLGLEIKILCQPFDIHLGVIESFGLSSIRSIANHLPMGAGVISNALYLKNQKKLSIANFTSSLTVSIVLMFLIAGFLGFITSVYLTMSTGSTGLNLVILFFSVFLTSLLLITIRLPILKSKNFIAEFIRNFQQGYTLLKKIGQQSKN
ncbi:MAG: hypothetical protein FP812_23430 [Desulfobacula sp.]|nr:hypothetical protein [Desulfobacula sp.]